MQCCVVLFFLKIPFLWTFTCFFWNSCATCCFKDTEPDHQVLSHSIHRSSIFSQIVIVAFRRRVCWRITCFSTATWDRSSATRWAVRRLSTLRSSWSDTSRAFTLRLDKMNNCKCLTHNYSFKKDELKRCPPSLSCSARSFIGACTASNHNRPFPML